MRWYQNDMALEMWPDIGTPSQKSQLAAAGSVPATVLALNSKETSFPRLGRPVQAATAIWVAGFGEAGPIPNDAPLYDEVGVCRAIAALPGKQERVLKGSATSPRQKSL